MDFKDPKIQKIFIGVAAFFIVAYFWYNRMYVTYDAKLDQMNQEYSTMITNLKNVEMKSKSLDALKIEYEDLLGKYQDIEQLLPEVKQIPSFLVQLHTASSLTGTKIKKIEPKPIEAQNFYNVASFKVEMSGTYHDFGKFIGYVANFPFITNVSDVQITSLAAAKLSEEEDDDGFGVKDKSTMLASFTLSTYFAKPEERLAELNI